MRWEPASGVLDVEAHVFEPVGSRFGVDRGADPYVHDLACAPDGAETWTPAKRRERGFELACDGPFRLRYRYALREAARTIDDLDVASDEGEVLEAPPSTWIVAPRELDGAARVRFRVATPAGSRFVTGVFARPDAKEPAWDITLDDLVTAPYSAFGPMRVFEVNTKGARIDIARAPGELRVTDDDLVAWTNASARAITAYFDRFPMPSALVVIVPGRSRWVGGGRTLSGGGGTIFIRVGRDATKAALNDDWVLVHEMVHLSFPSAPREESWAEEGLATYVEPFARVRAGLLSAEDAWRGLVEGLPNGLPGPGDRGLDRTPTWGRTYWGGALFYLLADVEIRKRTNDTKGLEHALRGVLAAGGSNAKRWPLDDTFAAGDAATGVSVLRDLHAAMGTSPHPVDLDALVRSLGVSVTRDAVTFDDRAPLAAIRRAITTGS